MLAKFLFKGYYHENLKIRGVNNVNASSQSTLFANSYTFFCFQITKIISYNVSIFKVLQLPEL